MIGLSQKYQETLQELFQKQPDIDEVILFGSRALGTHRPNSDIDVALKGDISHEVVSQLMWDYDDSDIPVSIDMVVYQSISSPELLDHIKTHGVTIYLKSTYQVEA